MNKWLIFLIIVLVCISIAIGLVACEDKNDDDSSGNDDTTSDDDTTNDDDPPLPTDDDDSQNDYTYIEYCMESVHFDESGYIVGQEPPSPWEVIHQGTISNATVDNFISKGLDPALHIVGGSLLDESVDVKYQMENLYEEIVIRFDFLIEKPVDYKLDLQGSIWGGDQFTHWSQSTSIDFEYDHVADDLYVKVEDLQFFISVICENISFDEWHRFKISLLDHAKGIGAMSVSIDGTNCGERPYAFNFPFHGLRLDEDTLLSGYGAEGWFDNLCIYGKIAGEEN